MALFRKRRKDTDAASEVTEEVSVTSSQEETPTSGPFDRADVDERGPRIDLGSLWIPGVNGMKMRFEVDRKSKQAIGVSIGIGKSALQLSVFAAPRTFGIWDEVREELTASIADSGGSGDEVDGPFGRELRARMTVKKKDGQTGLRPVRFIGVDGPRWFLRAVITGEATVRPEAAEPLEAILSQLVIIRDESARAPREPLPLRLPQPQDGQKADVDADGAEPADGLQLPGRGPEITEVR